MRFMTTTSFLFLMLVPMTWALDSHPVTDAYPGWQLAVQMWSFNRFTFYEGLDKAASLGLDWVEVYSDQRLSPDHGDVKFNHNMARDLRAQVKARLKELGIRVSSYGVVDLPGDEAKCRKIFEFARDFGIGTINSEPKETDLDMIESLCQEYRIKIGIHNHPKPSHYWNPDVVLAACSGRSHWIGACADTGHWVRSGLNPLECVRQLRGRISSLHLKEVDQAKGETTFHDVVWGQGKARVPDLLKELHAQNFQGVFAAEYEYHWENNVGEIADCVTFFRQVGASLCASGWKPLLAPTISAIWMP
jgi:sugar phosphate isomerase/epimerase